MKRFIYADNAATTKMDEDVVSSMLPFLTDAYGNPSQPYFMGTRAKKAINEARDVISQSIGARSNEIFFTSGGTESDNWAIKGFSSESERLLIVTSCIEHHAILNACKDISNRANIILLPVNHEGLVSCSDLKNALETVKPHKSAVLVSVMMANNEIGTIQPIHELAEIAHSYGAIFHTDAVQAVGHIKCHVDELGIDMLSASAHKFNGPKGTGFLYIREGTNIQPLISGGAQEKNSRAGTENVASIVGMATALLGNIRRLKENSEHISLLESNLIKRLNTAGISYIRNGANKHIPGNISLSFRNSDGEMILHRLDLKGICISTGSACDSVSHQVSHVIKSIQVDEEYAKGTIRISLGKNNTLDDVEMIAEELIKIIVQ